MLIIWLSLFMPSLFTPLYSETANRSWKLTGSTFIFHVKASDVLHSSPIWPAELSPSLILKHWDTNSKKIPMTDTTTNKHHVTLQHVALRPLQSFENQQEDNFMRSSITFQEAAILQHQRTIHHSTVTLAALDSIHYLIHYLVHGFF